MAFQAAAEIQLFTGPPPSSAADFTGVEAYWKLLLKQTRPPTLWTRISSVHFLPVTPGIIRSQTTGIAHAKPGTAQSQANRKPQIATLPMQSAALFCSFLFEQFEFRLISCSRGSNFSSVSILESRCGLLRNSFQNLAEAVRSFLACPGG